jgi:hypothetical protein
MLTLWYKWNRKYDDLAKTKPFLRFLIFFVPMVFVLSIPLFLKYIFDITMQSELMWIPLIILTVLRVIYLRWGK